MTDIIKEIANWMWEFNSFLVTSHEAGDGDSIGSQLALAAILRKMKKEVFIINKDPVPSMYNFLPGTENIKSELPIVNGKDWDVVMVVDCGSLERTGVVLPGKAKYINIDHHLNNEYFGHINWVRSDLSSTAEMIYLLWEATSIPMDTAIANSIYTGILTDTGGFRFSNTSSQALLIAARLVEAGVNPSYIASEVYDRRSVSQLLILGAALSNLKLSEDQKLAYIYLNKETFQKYGASSADTEGFVNYPLSISSDTMRQS